MDGTGERVRSSPPDAYDASWSMIFLAGGAGALAIFTLLDGAPRGWLLSAMALATATATGLAVRRRAARGGPLRALFVGTVLLVPAYTLWYPARLHLGSTVTDTSPADVFFLSAYSAFLVALLRLIRLHRRSDRRVQSLDSLIISVGLGVLMWVLLISPNLRDSPLSGMSSIVALTYPAVDLLLLGAVVRLLIDGIGSVGARLLTAWVMAQFAADTVYVVTMLRGTFELENAVAPLFFISLVLLGAGALHPTSGRGSAPRGRQRTPGNTGMGRLALVSSAALIAPIVLIVVGLRGEVRDVPVVAASSAVLFALVLARVGLLMVDVQEHRRVQQLLKARQELSDCLSVIQRLISTRAPIEEVLDTVMSSTRQILGDEVVVLRLVQDDDPDVRMVVRAQGLTPEEVASLERMPLHAGLGGRAMALDRVCTQQAYAAWPGALVALAGRRLRVAMAAPVRLDGRPVGSIVVGTEREGRTYEPAEQAAIEAFAEHVSLALNDSRAVAAVNDALDHALHQAMHDALTGLPNRACFYDRTGQALRLGRRDSTSTAVLLFDLDRFKEVNDTLGHRYGDSLLCQIGGRIRPLLREADTLARLGGDEFCVLLPEVEGEEAAYEVATRITATLEEPFEIEGINVAVEASCGIAVAPIHGDTADILLQRSDVAMYVAKRTHVDVVAYADDLDAHTPDRLALLGELRQAIADDQLVLHYQPQASLSTRAVQGVEALVRWEHPRLGHLLPGSFIPAAEESGLIRPLTSWVLETALDQLREWMDDDSIQLPDDFAMAVNLSARSFLDEGFHEEVTRALLRREIPAHRLVLEVTETTIMADPERAQRMLTDLAVLGIQFAIDDFGTGYSSLAALKSLPVQNLKIDQSFVSDMEVSSSDATIVRSVIDLGHTLGLHTIAEGVEGADVWDRLRELGCDSGQGHVLARPMPGPDLLVWLRSMLEPHASLTR